MKQPEVNQMSKPTSDFHNRVRPAVIRFAEEMERVLKENDHKGGWDPDQYMRTH